MTDFRARGTIMGPAGLTAVFGMGTGGAPQVSSPESGTGRSGPHHGTRNRSGCWCHTGDRPAKQLSEKQAESISGDDSHHGTNRTDPGWMRGGSNE